jgi:hypothetical protein
MAEENELLNEQGEQKAAPAEKQKEAVSDDPVKTVESEAKTDEGEAEAKPETDESRPKKNPSGYERQKRRAEMLERELTELRARVAPVDPGNLTSIVEKEIGPPPKESDFSDYLQFESERAGYAAAKRLKEAEIRNRIAGEQARVMDRVKDLQEDFQDRAEETAKAIPDFEKVIRDARDAPVAPHVAMQVLESEKGPLLQYHFAKNPDALERLNRMTAMQAAREIGRLEASLSIPRPRTKTAAPAPDSPVRGAAASKPSSITNFKDFEKWSGLD